MKLLLLLLSATAALSAQLPLGWLSNGLSPESASSFITSDGFTTLSHPDFLDHNVRIKRTDGWCDDQARSFTGYIDHGARHLFFYFFESRGNPAEDDLVLWTNGGPGCSSSIGLFMELGPCTTQKDGNSTKPNPYSWTSTASMIFIDQPVDVGFSYSTHGRTVGTTEEAALDINAFLHIFLETFSEFKGRPFHLAGESYGGRYIPVFGSEIIYQNSLLAKSNSSRTPINLSSVIIGNGLTDFVSMTTSYYDQACTSVSGVGKPVLDIKTCIAMQQDVKLCDGWLKKVCRDTNEEPACSIAFAYCAEKFEGSFFSGGINPYNIEEPCTTLEEDLCYPQTSVIKTYLDQPWVRETIGADARVGPFESCSSKVGLAFAQSGDGLAPTFYHLGALLENDVRVLVYVGTLDWICNWIGNYRMLQETLEWSGKEQFVAQDLRNWKSPASEERAGQTKSFGGLTWVTVEKAGHMVPYDQPEASLSMVQRWLAKKEI